ncbi:hypothetical protein YWY31_10180 [Paenibacillus illinoisensis]|uniref:hypothetical protein n=1 Tax=Paenibacillus illinoisensis TaxID=59845 RepID=UPI0034AE383C
MERDKPILGDQELEQIHRTMVFDPVDDKAYEGIVSTTNMYLKEIKFVWEKNEYMFINIDKIISTSI